MNEQRLQRLKEVIRLWIDPRVRPTKRTRRIYYMGYLIGFSDGWYDGRNDYQVRRDYERLTTAT